MSCCEVRRCCWLVLVGAMAWAWCAMAPGACLQPHPGRQRHGRGRCGHSNGGMSRRSIAQIEQTPAFRNRDFIRVSGQHRGAARAVRASACLTLGEPGNSPIIEKVRGNPFG